jgi:hypothetical protein
MLDGDPIGWRGDGEPIPALLAIRQIITAATGKPYVSVVTIAANIVG